MSIMTVTLDGYLAKDAEQKQTNGGRRVLNVTVPHQTSKKNDQGGYDHTSETLWVQFALWDDEAAYWAPKLVKGTHVQVQGQGALEAWESANNSGTNFVIRFPMLNVIPKREQQGGQRQQSDPGAFRGGQADEPWGQPSGQSASGWATPGQAQGGASGDFDSPPF